MIQYLIANGLFEKAGQKLMKMYKEVRELKSTFPHHSSNESNDRLTRLSQSVDHAESIAYDAFCQLIFTPEQADSEYSSAILAAQNTGIREQFIKEFVQSSQMSSSTLSSYHIAHERATEVIETYRKIVASIASKNRHEIALTARMAETLAYGLSTACKASLTQQLQGMVKSMDEGDVLYYAVCAFIRLLYVKESAVNTEENDKRVLEAFANIKGVYPRMARHLSNSLQKHLNRDGSLLDMSLFGPYGGSHQAALIHYLSEGHLGILRTCLASRIQRLLETPIVDLKMARLEWLAHGKMLQLLLDLPGPSSAGLRNRLYKLQKKAQRVLDKNLGPLCESDIKNVDMPSLILQENNVLRAVLFMRAFGNPNAQRKGEVLLDKLLAKQRKAMMRLNMEATTEQFITFSYDVIMVGGSAEQVQHSDNLVHAWHVYCGDLASLMALGEAESLESRKHGEEVHRQAVLDAMDDYLIQLDSCIFGYFSHQFALEKPFFEKAYLLRNKMANEHINADKISQHQLQDLMRSEQAPIRWHWHVPKMRDAEQLLVGLCVSAHAHQWIEHWKSVLNDTKSSKDFSPMELCEDLKTLAIDLIQQFHLGHGRFTSHLATAIGAAGDYFVPSGESGIAETPVLSPVANQSQYGAKDKHLLA